MNILLVNDDGYYAEGINRLKKQLEGYGTIYMVAPAHQQSAKSCSVHFGVDLDIVKIDDFNYTVEGTPADCVAWACRNLGVKFDLVVSGCNQGLNCSLAVIWSGTLGACIEAGVFKIPAIAFSVRHSEFHYIDEYAKKVLDYIFENKLVSMDAVLSVNFPYGDVAKGIKLSECDYNNFDWYIDTDKGIFMNVNPDGSMDLNFKNKNGDLYHLANDYISICPLTYNYGNKEIYDKIRAKCVDVEF